ATAGAAAVDGVQLESSPAPGIDVEPAGRVDVLVREDARRRDVARVRAFELAERAVDECAGECRVVERGRFDGARQLDLEQAVACGRAGEERNEQERQRPPFDATPRRAA